MEGIIDQSNNNRGELKVDEKPPCKKIKIGWFSFSCSEDSTIVLTELMNEHWQNWREIFDFRYAPVIKTKNILDGLDIAFIEGAIASEVQIKRLQDIRERSKYLVAVGSCAVTGLPAGQRNNFSIDKKEAIWGMVEKFKGLPRVLKVSEVVTVDAEVPGCPMNDKIFLFVVNKIVSLIKNG